jgi:hypothetical protein
MEVKDEDETSDVPSDARYVRLVDQIKSLAFKLSKLGIEDENTKQFILYELNCTILDLIKKIRTIESDRHGDLATENQLLKKQAIFLSSRNSRLQKRIEQNSANSAKLISHLRTRICNLENELAQTKLKVRKFRDYSSDKDDLYQQLLELKAKMIVNYLTNNKPQEINLEKQSRLFNW